MSELNSNIVAPAYAWPAAMGAVTIGGTLAAACAMPFVGLAVVAAATMDNRRSVTTVVAAWAANQALGFGLLGYPSTPYAVSWGLALGGASVAALFAGRAVLGEAGAFRLGRLAFAFAAAFTLYEGLLYLFAGVAGGRETFAPGIVVQILANDAVWLVVLVAIRLGLGRATPRLFGPAPALRIA